MYPNRSHVLYVALITEISLNFAICVEDTDIYSVRAAHNRGTRSIKSYTN